MDKLKILVVSLIILTSVRFVYADTVILTDGRKINGNFIKGDDKKIVFISEGITMDFPRDLVSFISFGEKGILVNAGTRSVSNGKIKGVITYYHNRYIGSKPDLGATVYACKTKVDVGKSQDIMNDKEIDDFIKTFYKYHRARINRENIALTRSAAEMQKT